MATWAALLLPLGPVPAAAEEPAAPFERVSFSVERRAPVDNDRVHVVLAVHREGGRPAELADEVNRTMERALEVVRETREVTGRTAGYSTHQTTTPQRERVWVVDQDLELEAATGDLGALRALLGELQAELQLRSMSFEPSDTARRAAEDALVREALGAFRARAGLVRESLGFPDSRIVELHVDTGGTPMPFYARSRGGDMAMMAEAAAPPALEAGTSDVTVTVRGTIQLQPAP